MAARNEEIPAASVGEDTPLLREQAGSIGGDDRSSETLTDAQGRGEEDLEDANKANQQVGRLRGLLIILSLWGLIFLQGRSISISYCI